MEEWWGRLWWTKSGGRFWPIVKKRLREREVRFTHNSSTVVWIDLCRDEVHSEWFDIFDVSVFDGAVVCRYF
jgi:hypothetical protein